MVIPRKTTNKWAWARNYCQTVQILNFKRYIRMRKSTYDSNKHLRIIFSNLLKQASEFFEYFIFSTGLIIKQRIRFQIPYK
jgi:hypothetical protein